MTRFGRSVVLAYAGHLLLAGCALIPSTSAHVAAVHTSQPGHGPGIEPIGDHGQSPETTYDAAEFGLRVKQGRWFCETDMAFVLHDTYLTGGPWLFSARFGYTIFGDRND